jgi:hypothetical protein
MDPNGAGRSEAESPIEFTIHRFTDPLTVFGWTNTVPPC